MPRLHTNNFKRYHMRTYLQGASSVLQTQFDSRQHTEDQTAAKTVCFAGPIVAEPKSV